MTRLEADQIIRRRLGLVERTIADKRKGYASDADVLHNFHEAAGLEGCTTEDALRGMLVKHWVSLRDLRMLKAAGVPITRELIDEKIGDAVNYLCLLECALLELECVLLEGTDLRLRTPPGTGSANRPSASE